MDPLNEREIARYREQGFLHVPGVLSPGEIAEFLADARELLERQKTLDWPADTGSVMDWVADVELKSPAMRRLALHPVITSVAEQLAGQPLRLFKSELLRKRTTGAAATPLHIDDFAFPFSGAPVTLTAWVALVDVPVERGSMTFLPGSHRLELFDASASAALEDPEEAWASLDLLSQNPELRFYPRVTIPLRAGDCTFHHCRTAHLAHTNETDVTRISLATVYMDAEARFDRSRFYGADIQMDDELSKLLSTLDTGQPLSGERFPRVS